MLKTTVSVAAAVVMGISGLNAESADKNVVVVAAPTAGQHSSSQQRIEPAPSTQGYKDTIVYARGAKKEYAVGEPIRVQLKIKRNAYIYFWTISYDGRGYLIMPNDFTSFNKFTRNTEYVVPERSAKYEFVSDRAGVEEVYVLATTKKISEKRIGAIFNKKAGGVIPVASSKNIKNFVSKDIMAIAKRENIKYDIERFDIAIYDDRPEAANQKTEGTSVNITINQ